MIGCHVSKWDIPDRITGKGIQVSYHVEVELLDDNNDQYLAWIITFTEGHLKMWIGSNENDTYGEMLNDFMLP